MRNAADASHVTWLSRNASPIEAIAACITAVVAVGALIGVTIQLDEADRLQREQSAREAYRGHLVLAVASPQFSRPMDGCQLIASNQGGAYAAFVDHLLYSAEQMLAVSDGWDETFLIQLESHKGYLCSENAPLGATDETARLLLQFRATTCDGVASCLSQ
ncbi:hypothetical protein [Phaeobacter sp. C3_T13_0]|uniref:hypothetical protein n=1 Tax=Phaeobacter cretensis TaxID=3342641 RepID=UPI0039BCAF56